MSHSRNQRGASPIELLLLLALIAAVSLTAIKLLPDHRPSTAGKLEQTLHATRVELRAGEQYVATFPGGKLCIGRYQGAGTATRPTGKPRCTVS